jgi:two-component system phosphate regulon sensor histidine kinase PhoR
MKVDFVANASHELRTPLATIRAALDNIIDGVYDDAESLRTVFEVLNRHVARLEALIEDLLSLHSVEDTSVLLRQERTTAKEQQLWLDELFREKAVARDLALSFDMSENLPPFITDNKRLGLILQNLVDNAIKFTPPGGKVTVGFARENGSQLVITCTDTGCGIAPHEQDRVFERFYQSNASRTGDSRIRGTGLGLAIVKHAVERLNGTVALTSRLGFGTTMTVRIPVEFHE